MADRSSFVSPAADQRQSAIDVLQVAAGVGNSFATAAVPICGQIVMHASGTLSYVDLAGTTKVLTALPAGTYAIYAQAINAATNVAVTCLFF